MSKPSQKGVLATVQSKDCTKHITWLKTVFGAEVKEIYHTQDKKHVMHCALIINEGYLYLCDNETSLEEKSLSKDERETNSAGIILQVECKDPNPYWKTALANGGTVITELQKQYWGGVYGQLRDPFGFVWGLLLGGECRKPGVIPYLTVKDCNNYLEWAQKALGGVVKDKFMSDQGYVLHCSVETNGGLIYLGEDTTEGQMAPVQSHVVLHRNVADPSTQWDRLKQHGASTVVDLKVQFWGDLYGTSRDSKGYYWSLCKLAACDVSDSPKETGVLAYILSPNCKKHVEWIERVLGGEVKQMNTVASGEVMHCQMTVNGGTLMLSDRFNISQPDNPTPLKQQEGASEQEFRQGVILQLCLDNPDSVWKRAVENGGVEVVPLGNQFWGGYYGQIKDPLGYIWAILRNE